MEVCKQCCNTGITELNKFCRCEAGYNRRKQLHDHALKAVGLEPEITTYEFTSFDEPIKQMQEEYKKHINFTPGDWVQYGSLIGVVGRINAIGQVRFIAYKDTNGKLMDHQGWINGAMVKHLPIETFDDSKVFLIDLALMTKDYQWLEELTN